MWKSGDVEGPLEKIVKTVLKIVRDRSDISDNLLDIISQSIILNYESFTCYAKSIRGFRMCQGDPLYPIQDIIWKTL